MRDTLRDGPMADVFMSQTTFVRNFSKTRRNKLSSFIRAATRCEQGPLIGIAKPLGNFNRFDFGVVDADAKAILMNTHTCLAKRLRERLRQAMG